MSNRRKTDFSIWRTFIIGFFVLVLTVLCMFKVPVTKAFADSRYEKGDCIVLNSDCWWIRSSPNMDEEAKYAKVFDNQVMVIADVLENEWYKVCLPQTGGQRFYLRIPADCSEYFCYYYETGGLPLETNWQLYVPEPTVSEPICYEPVETQSTIVTETEPQVIETVPVVETVAVTETAPVVETVLVTETTTQETTISETTVVETTVAKTTNTSSSAFEIGDCIRFKGEFWTAYEVPILDYNYKLNKEIVNGDELIVFKKYGDWYGLINWLYEKRPSCYVHITSESAELFEKYEHVDHFDELHPFDVVTGPITTSSITTTTTTTTTVATLPPAETTDVDSKPQEASGQMDLRNVERGDVYRFNCVSYAVHTNPYLDSEVFTYLNTNDRLVVLWDNPTKYGWYRVQDIETSLGGYIYVPPGNTKYFDKIAKYTDVQMKHAYWRLM